MQLLPTIFEDENILLVHKPVGFLAQHHPQGIPQHLFPAHRLDQRVSGLLLLAKNAAMAHYFTNAFASKQINKQYKAIVAAKPQPNSATITHWLKKDSKLQKAKAYNKEVANSKQAILSYSLLQQSEKYTMLHVELSTGRFHQIRAQLAAIGSPIVGDVKYGYKRTTVDGSIFLQAYKIAFMHPITKENLSFSLPIPDLRKKFGMVDDNRESL